MYEKSFMSGKFGFLLEDKYTTDSAFFRIAA
jgi:hypothetical protein